MASPVSSWLVKAASEVGVSKSEPEVYKHVNQLHSQPLACANSKIIEDAFKTEKHELILKTPKYYLLASL
eukprot:4385405-Amphidinium_carterae.1